MLSSIQGLFGKKDNVATPVTESDVSVRSPDDIDSLEKMIKVGPITFVLVHADWCGPCQGYKPIWKDLEKAPGRNTNMAMVHHDMVEKSPTLKNAKIPGYPSVLKVYSNGHIEEYKGEGNKKTNALPNIRDKPLMLNELKSATSIPKILNLNASTLRQPTPRKSTPNPVFIRSPVASMPSFVPSRTPVQQTPVYMPKRVSLFNKNPIRNLTIRRGNRRNSKPTNTLVYKQYPASELTRRDLTNNAIKVSNMTKPSTSERQSIGASVPPMKGGALYQALGQALMRAGPATILFAANQMLPNKRVRGSTMRRTRKSNTRRSKN